jgi:hypothetical protein
VVAHYQEDTEQMAETLKQVKARLPPGQTTRTIIYHKGGRDASGVRELRDIADEVVVLPNIGREGETYLVSRQRAAARDTAHAG